MLLFAAKTSTFNQLMKWKVSEHFSPLNSIVQVDVFIKFENNLTQKINKCLSILRYKMKTKLIPEKKL